MKRDPLRPEEREAVERERAYKRPPPKWLRSAQVAAILDCSPKTVNRWAREGRLPFDRTLGGHRRYDERVIRLIALGMYSPATDGPAAAAGGGS